MIADGGRGGGGDKKDILVGRTWGVLRKLNCSHTYIHGNCTVNMLK